MSEVTFRGAMQPSEELRLRGPFTEEIADALRERNEQRLKDAIRELGERWLLWQPLGRKQ